MNKLIATGAALAAAGIIALSAATARDTTEATDLSTMMGGDCPMMGMMGHGMRHQGWGGKRWRRHHGRMGAMVEGRLAYLKTALEVSETQQKAWDGYAEAVKNRVGAMQAMHASMMTAMQDGGAIERMEARITGMEAMVEAMKAIKPATEALYAVLSGDQKKKADELIGLGCGGM